MKKVITFLMVLALVLSLGATAFAAGGTGSITVDNAVNDVDYKLYKIFDATYKEGSPDADGDGTLDVVSYTLETSSPVYTYMFNDKPTVDGKIVGDYFTYEVATKVVTLNSGVNNSDVFAYLTKMVRDSYNDTVANDGCFVAKKTAADQKVVFENLEYGYYLIDTEQEGDDNATRADIAVTITTNTPDAKVIEKNDIPGDLKKETDTTDVKVGDTIEWTVTFRATNYTEDKKITEYIITDTLSSDWADFNLNSFVVKVGDDVLTKGTDYTVTANSDTMVTINIPWATLDDEDHFVSFLYDAVETVTIIYSATVNENAPTAGVLKNTADMKWEQDDGGIGDGGDDDTETDTYNLGFTKVDGTDTTKTLSGAVFALYSDAACTTPVPVKATETDGVYIYDKTSASNEVTTPTSGQVIILGLEAGTYYLKEIKAPDGYNKLAAAQSVVIGKDHAEDVLIGEVTYTLNNATLQIANNRGVELPSTGGKGTMMLITVGTVVAMAFAMLLITQKKMSIYRD